MYAMRLAVWVSHLSRRCHLRSVRRICLINERKLLHSHPNNYRHPFFQTNCKNIVVKLTNVKEFDIFSPAIGCPFFIQIPSKIVNSVFPSKVLNFVISSIFCPKRFCSGVMMVVIEGDYVITCLH